MNKPAVSLRDLHVTRGGRVVFDGLDLDIPAGRVVGLLGPSGSGKSTLIRCVVGVQQVASGEVTVLGHPAGTRPLRNQVGYLTQTASVYDDLSVVDNVAYFGSLLGKPRRAAMDAVERVGLADHAKALAGNLSGGQRQRVSLASALVGRPELLVLDEPTVGLDPVLRRSLWQLFHELADEGTSLLVSSHVMDEASRCDELVLLRAGRVLAHDTLPAILAATGAEDAERAFLHLIDTADAKEN